MDKIWLDNGIDFRMKPYKVLSTDDMGGMIEIVTDSETTARIHNSIGGTLGAYDETTYLKWLEKNNPGDEIEIAKENFIMSTAGYTVATYILGIFFIFL